MVWQLLLSERSRCVKKNSTTLYLCSVTYFLPAPKVTLRMLPHVEDADLEQAQKEVDDPNRQPSETPRGQSDVQSICSENVSPAGLFRLLPMQFI